MDRFVIKTKKRKADNINEVESGETSEPSVAECSEISVVSQNVPEQIGQMQTNQPNRKFRAEWEDLFFVSDYKGKAICLICRIDFTQNKKFTFERHFNKNHSHFNDKYPLSSKQRATQISKLKTELASEQKIVKQFASTNELVSRALFEIAFEIAKHGKPYSDGEFYKKLMQSTTETLCQNLDDKQKAPLLDKIKKLPLSHQTIARRITDIGSDIESKLKRDLQQCEAFSLALDESTDIKSASQLLFWVRYYVNDHSNEDMLAVVSLREQKRGVDILDAFLQVSDRFGLDLKKLVSVCTDGDPSMIGKDNGFVALLKKYVAEYFGHQISISYHCIIHQENLCAKALEKDCMILKTVTKVRIAENYTRHSFGFICLLNSFIYTDILLNYRSSTKFVEVAYVIDGSSY